MENVNMATNNETFLIEKCPAYIKAMYLILKSNILKLKAQAEMSNEPFPFQTYELEIKILESLIADFNMEQWVAKIIETEKEETK